ncbi:hypothetical protein CDL12_09214 [Handroanthus impetiginosus]|uniref:Uncharacterized protein n=1 Tax=Handroanthus impetiginosus TaxID=429701 RepID=A0A2G9HKS8_9LAMI|nr:hypothetical protein CDL12_09214 [Handroanthus impetiginosus]
MGNTLVVGVPILKAMHSPFGENLVSSLWFPLVLFMLESRHTLDYNSNKSCGPGQLCSIEIVFWINQKESMREACKNPNIYSCSLGLIWGLLATRLYLSRFGDCQVMVDSLLKMSLAAIVLNPTHPQTYGAYGGEIFTHLPGRSYGLRYIGLFCWNGPQTGKDYITRWAANSGSESIIAAGMLFFGRLISELYLPTAQLFMALQEKTSADGMQLTIYSKALRFVGRPFTMAIGAQALGLGTNVLCIVLIQAALPQRIISFVFEKVIFGMIISLPLLIAYYAILDVLH